MRRPFTLSCAVVLQWVAALTMIVSGIATLVAAFAVNSSSVKEAIDQTLDNQGVGNISGSTVVSGVLAAGLLLIGVAVLRSIIAVALGRGRAWARVVLTIFAGLSVLTAVGTLFQGLAGLLLGAGSLALEAVILWLMWNRTSSEYIRQRSA